MGSGAPLIEPPYPAIAGFLKEGNVVPFLGAGASLVGRPEGAVWDGAQPFLPNGAELARAIAQASKFPSSDDHDVDDLAKVSSYYAEFVGRKWLMQYLRKQFMRDMPTSPLHQVLASIKAPMLLVATNYDTLLEKAFRDAGTPYHLVVYPADWKSSANAGSVLLWRHGEAAPIPVKPEELDLHIDLSKTSVIYKMHGTVMPGTADWDNFVITEEDYVDFLSRMTANTAIPKMLLSHCADRNFLFLGYSLRDWNLRVILNNLRKFLSRGDSDLSSWAIQHNPSVLEEKLWGKRDVEIFKVRLDDFAANLRTALE